MIAEIVILAERKPKPKDDAIVLRSVIASNDTFRAFTGPDIAKLADELIEALEDRGFRIVPIEAGKEPA
jgi:hypothetical protein